MRRVQFYSLYERLWHWLQAVAILGLLLTGVELHWPGTLHILGFANAVNVHNILGFVLVGNAFLSLFYHAVSGEIRQFMPEPRDFFSLAIAQMRYYARGIFKNAPHPIERTPAQKLNPLQKIAYLVLLNVLLPLQTISGILIWGAQRWPGAIDGIGGLPTLAKVHTLVAWLLAAFVIMHTYLTTTGRTSLSHIRAMILGWDYEEDAHVEHKQART